MITWITPTLRVSDETEALTPLAAIALIKSDMNDTWPIADVATLDDARAVMKGLGMSDFAIEDRCHFALTGEVLRA